MVMRIDLLVDDHGDCSAYGDGDDNDDDDDDGSGIKRW